jgi:hypothetical protein
MSEAVLNLQLRKTILFAIGNNYPLWPMSRPCEKPWRMVLSSPSGRTIVSSPSEWSGEIDASRGWSVRKSTPLTSNYCALMPQVWTEASESTTSVVVTMALA